MPPLPVISNTSRCALHYVATGGAYAVNVIHITHEAGTPSAGDTGAAIVAAWPNHMMTGIPGSVAMDYIDVTPLDGVSTTVRTPTGSAGEFVGEQAGDWLAQVASIVKLQTGLRGRSFRGRVYRPFTAEETATNGFLDSANVALLQTAWENFIASLAADAFSDTLVVASYKLATKDPVVSVNAEAALATQRRRQTRLR
jgi:hypothetical protein